MADRLARVGAAAALAVVLGAAATVSCRPHTVVRDGEVGPAAPRRIGESPIRVALATAAAGVRIGGDGDWRLDGDASVLARGTRGAAWSVQRDGRRIRALRPDGVGTVWQSGPIVVRALGEGLLRYNGKRYRGDLVLVPSDTGIVVVNRVALDDYLKGVVPLELGGRDERDMAAMQAQAVAARSYAAIHLGSGRIDYDLTGGVLDQVYGGADAETALGTRAVESTRGLVLTYGGRVVNAPYHSTCGGSTADASEIWRTRPEPYLQRVSDQIPGTDRYYCDIAPRFRWTRTFDGAALDAAVRRYIGQYAREAGRDPGRVQAVEIDSRTASGRVGILRVATDRGNYVLRGNDARFVLRSPGGEILNSTYFSVETVTGSDGAVARLTLRGTGYGHGVGMCQWGAIGRSRAGADFRDILQIYYPGATVGSVD